MSGTQIRLPDGRTITVQTDDPKAAARAARIVMDREQASKPRGFFDTAADFVDNTVDNLLPNWGDELRGAGRAARAFVSGKDTGAAFRQGQADFKRDQERFKREHPNLATASTVAGMGAGMLLPAAKALKGASMARQALQSGLVGLVSGVASGAGEGEGLDLQRRATNAVASGATGLVMGAGTPYALKGAQVVGRAARANVPGVDAVVSKLPTPPPWVRRGRKSPQAPNAAAQQANRIAGSRMNEATISKGPAVSGPAANPQAIADEVALRQEVGVPAMIGDVSEPMRELTSYTSRGMGPGQTMVRQRLAERKALEGSRVRQHVRDTLPTVDDPIAFVADQQRNARAAAKPLYEAAYGQPMYRTPPIQAIEQTPAFRDALPQAYTNIRNQIDETTGLPKDPSAMGFRYFDGEPGSLAPNDPYFALPERGYVAYGKGLSVEGYDQVARAMGDSGRAAAIVNPTTGRVQDTTNSVHINQRANDLRRLLREQNSYYDEAVGRFGDDMTYTNAFQQGQDVGKLTGHEINAQRGNIPEQAHEAWATGAGTAMADEASQYAALHPTGAAASRVRQMLGDDVKQNAISEMTGNSGGVRQLQDRLEYEQQGHINWQSVQANSRGAAREQLDAELDQGFGIPVSKAGMVSRLVDFVAQRAAPQYRSDLKARIAHIVTASDAKSVGEVMEAILQQAQRDQQFSDFLHVAGVGGSAAYGMNLEPVSPVEEAGW